MADPKIKAGIDFKATGLEEMRKQINLSKVDMALYSAAIIGATSKVQALGWALKDALITTATGPVGVLAGGLFGIVTTLRMILKETGAMDAALARIRGVEMLQQQFVKLLGSMALAKQRISELSQFKGSDLFGLNSVAGGSKELERLTKGALSTKESLTQIGDAAAGTGSDFESTSVAMGSLYAELASGSKDIGATVGQLEDMNVISKTVGDQMERLAAAGRPMSEIWGLAQKEMSKFSGSMDDVGGTLSGMQAKVENAKGKLAAALGAPFADSERKSIKATLDLLTALEPVVSDLAQTFAPIMTATTDAVSSIVSWASKSSIAVNGLTIFCKAFALILISSMGAALVAAGGWAIKTLGSIRQLSSGVADATAVAKNFSEALKLLVSGEFATGVQSVAAAFKALGLAIQEAYAAGGVKGAAMFIVTNGLRAAWIAVAAAARLATAAILETVAALAANPVAWIVAAAAALGYMWQQANSVTSAIEKMGDEALATLSKMQKLVNSITTLEEKSAAIAQLTDARDKANQEIAASQDKQKNEWWDTWGVDKETETVATKTRDALDRQIAEAQSKTGLSSAEDLERNKMGRRRGREIEDIAREGEMGRASNPEDQINLMLEKRKKLQDEFDAANSSAIDPDLLKLQAMEATQKAGVDMSGKAKEMENLRAKVEVANERRSQVLSSSPQAVAALDEQIKTKRATDLPQYAASVAQLQIQRQILDLTEQTAENETAKGNAEIASLRVQKEAADIASNQLSSAQIQLQIDQKISEERQRQVDRARELKKLQEDLSIGVADQGVKEALVNGKYAEAERLRATSNAQQDAAFFNRRQQELQAGGQSAGDAMSQAAKELALRQHNRDEAAPEEARIGAQREIALMKAQAKGDTKTVNRIQDEDALKAKFNEYFASGMAAGPASKLATDFVSAKIANEAPNSNPTVDSLQKLGLGGTVASDGSVALDIQRRQEEIQKEMRDYLKEIASTSTTAGSSLTIE